MAKRRVIKVFEHQPLLVGENTEKNITAYELDKLLAFNDRHGHVYFTGIRNGVKFNNYVGVIQIGGLTIEILPKADKYIDNTEENKKKWHNALLKMLGVCKKVNITSVSETQLKKRYRSLLDLYFEMYVNEVSRLLHKGLIKQYRKKSANTTSLKGRIDFAKNIQHNIIHQERFFTTHQVYDYNHLANWVLFEGLEILQNLNTSPLLKDRISALLTNFPELQGTKITAKHFDLLRKSRKLDDYQKAIDIAKMLILNYSPDLNSGRDNMLAILFDMNKLWEEYVYQILVRTKNHNYNIVYQNGKYFWETRKIKPDIVLEDKTDGTIKYIIDTKWKLIEDGKPADEDLKQMFTYNIYWKLKRSMLLYPKTYSVEESFGNFHVSPPGENQCKLGFINILNDSGELDLEIGSSILNKLKNN